MAVVPVIFSGVFYPKNKKDGPMPGTFIGNAAIAGLEVGGGPAEPPPDVPPGEKPPVIWGPGDPRPSNPIWWEGFPNNPPPNLTPPDDFPNPGAIKPFPPDGGWGYSDRTGWVYQPAKSAASPKR